MQVSRLAQPRSREPRHATGNNLVSLENFKHKAEINPSAGEGTLVIFACSLHVEDGWMKDGWKTEVSKAKGPPAAVLLDFRTALRPRVKPRRQDIARHEMYESQISVRALKELYCLVRHGKKECT